jgi:serine/threonine-protein kinase
MDPVASSDTSLAPAAGLSAGTVVAGRYRVERLLGSGGMGSVYRAEHVHMRKTVALKVLHPEYASNPEVVARFEREAIAAARIEHPNVVAASDFGKLDDGSFYLVLEFIDGQSLRSLLAQGPISTARALEITRQTALALSAAHAAQIVHRDLKPDNVMLLSDPGGTERIKVLDFGIARVSGANPTADATHLTRVGVVIGTVAYMSPEQATGQAVDGRSDLYSLGVMLYEMISGRQPFEAELPSQVLARQLVEPPPPLPSDTPPALEKLVNDLMAKSPKDRPQTARELLDRLANLNRAPERAAPVALLASGRPRLIVGAAVLALLLVALILALTGGEGSATATAESALPSVSGAPPTPLRSAPAVLPESTAAKTGRTASSATATTGAPGGTSRTAPKSTARRKSGSGDSTPKEKRRTGPGGIYIPPPSTWFKGLE